MSRVCAISGKGPLTGNKRSHSLRATRRKRKKFRRKRIYKKTHEHHHE